MQNAKDTFYEELRAKMAAVNPERTVVVRAALRPGVLVDENELVGPELAMDCFQLSWGDVQVDTHGELPMVSAVCEISYETAGTAQNSGMDRGRMLSAMDGEILEILQMRPRLAQKNDYSALQFGGIVKTKATNIWWGDASFGALSTNEGRLRRTITVPIMSYQEAGEL